MSREMQKEIETFPITVNHYEELPAVNLEHKITCKRNVFFISYCIFFTWFYFEFFKSLKVVILDSTLPFDNKNYVTQHIFLITYNLTYLSHG